MRSEDERAADALRAAVRRNCPHACSLAHDDRPFYRTGLIDCVARAGDRLTNHEIDSEKFDELARECNARFDLECSCPKPEVNLGN